jgi:hypothetical protein
VQGSLRGSCMEIPQRANEMDLVVRFQRLLAPTPYVYAPYRQP